MTSCSGALERDVADGDRWQGDRARLLAPRTSCGCAGRSRIEHTLARRGAERLWDLLMHERLRRRARRAHRQPGGAAGQGRAQGDLPQRLAGRRRREPRRDRCIPTRASTRRTASRPSCAGSTTRCAAPTRSSAPRGSSERDWFAPIVADAEAGFGGPLNAYELMKAMIEAGAAGVHFEDQLSSEKKCGHMGGKVARPDGPVHPHADRGAARGRRDGRADGAGRAHRRALREAAHVRRRRARPRVPHRRAHRRGLLPRARTASSRRSRAALAYAPYADVLWCETSTPDLDEARAFAEAIHAEFPGKLLAYNCSPSFNWRKHLDDDARSRGSSRSWARWATSSSSSRWPASTR